MFRHNLVSFSILPFMIEYRGDTYTYAALYKSWANFRSKENKLRSVLAIFLNWNTWLRIWFKCGRRRKKTKRKANNMHTHTRRQQWQQRQRTFSSCSFSFVLHSLHLSSLPADSITLTNCLHWNFRAGRIIKRIICHRIADRWQPIWRTRMLLTMCRIQRAPSIFRSPQSLHGARYLRSEKQLHTLVKRYNRKISGTKRFRR